MATIDDDFEILKKYYDEILNKDESLVETSNDIPTPIDCVEEMINKIPDEFLKNPAIRILDPCCGCGNFPVVLYYRLRQYHSKDHILRNMLFFNDLNRNRTDKLKDVFDYTSLNVTNDDFLVFTSSHKFDLVLANPPFAKLLPNGKRASKNHNLIGAFIKQSLTLLNDNGFLLYISPDNWMSYANRNTLISVLTGYQIHHINIHCAKKYFKKVGSSFVWYLIEKTPFYKDISVDGIWKKKEYSGTVKSEVRKFIPLYYNRHIQSILNKTIDKNNKKFKVETTSYLHKYTKKKMISNEKDEAHIYKLIHTPKQTVWSSVPHKFQDGYKVFISTTSYYKTFIDNCGMTQSIAFIRCKDLEEAIRVKQVLDHPLYKFLNDICRYGNFNNIRVLQHFPYCDDVNKVNEMFNLTDDEKKHILETL